MRLSFNYFASGYIRQRFNHEIFQVSEQINSDVHNHCLSVAGGIDLIQKEIDLLTKQERLLQMDKIEQYVAVRLEKNRENKQEILRVILAQVVFLAEECRFILARKHAWLLAV